MQYIWTDMDNNVLSTDINFTRIFNQANIYEKTLTVMDDHNQTSMTRICIFVDKSALNIPLIAQAGLDVITNTKTPVVITGHAVCKNGDFSYVWQEEEKILANRQTLKYLFAEGTHSVTFKLIEKRTSQYAIDQVTIAIKPLP